MPAKSVMTRTGNRQLRKSEMHCLLDALMRSKVLSFQNTTLTLLEWFLIVLKSDVLYDSMVGRRCSFLCGSVWLVRTRRIMRPNPHNSHSLQLLQ